MIIRSVEFQCYGPFTNRTFEFRRGLNLVYGPNESGKTTLMESVAMALYGGREGQSFRSWGLEGNCRITLLLEGEGSSVRLNRDLASGRTAFLRTDDMYRTLFRFEGIADPESDDEKARQLAAQLQEIFGLPGAAEFRDILTFQQDRTDFHAAGALSPGILSICHQSDDKTLERAIADLDGEYLSLTRKNPWGDDLSQDGPLEQIRSQLEELEENWFLLQETLKSLSQVRKDAAALESEIDVDEGELAKGERFLNRLRASSPDAPSENNSASRELADIDARREKVMQLVCRRDALMEERNELNLGDSPDYEVPALAEEAEEARQNLHALQTTTADLRRELIDDAGPSWLFPSGAMAAFFALAGILAYLYPDLMVHSLLGACFLSVVGWAVHFWFLGSKKSEIGARKERMLALDEQREKAQTRLSEIDARLEQAGLPISFEELKRIRDQFARHRDIEGELREIDSALSVLEGLAELDEKRKEVLDRISLQEETSPGQREDPAGPEDIAEAEERFEEFQLQLDAKKERLSELRQQIKDLLEEVRELGKIEKEGERLKERETRIRQRLAVLATARELLSRIDGRHEGAEVEKLTEVIGRHAGQLTGGRYRQIRIDDSGQVLLQARGGAWEPLSRFGRATVDAIGLAVPMALIEIFFHGRSVPLLLDEPLVNLDQKRMDATLKQLEKMAAHHQVILFSHQESLLKKAAKAGWNLITLNGKEDKRSSRHDERSKDDEQQLHLL